MLNFFAMQSCFFKINDDYLPSQAMLNYFKFSSPSLCCCCCCCGN